MSKKAIIYARVSTDDQQDNYSLPSQLQMCRDHAAKQGYKIVAEFTEAFTGTTLNRPQLNEVIKSIGTFDVLIVHSVNRLSRDPADLLAFHKRLFMVGITIEYILDPIDATSDLGEAMLFFQGYAAKQYRKTFIEQSKRGKRERAKAGKFNPHGVTPYGYQYDQETGLLTINEEEAAVVRLIFHWYVYGDETGKKLGSINIANKLTGMGFPTRFDTLNRKKNVKKAGVWNRSSISKIVINEVYIGKLYYGVHRHKPLAQQTDPSTWVVIDVTPIISPELFQLAREQSKSNFTRGLRNTRHETLFRSRLVCAKCGGIFMINHRKAGKMYRCKGTHRHTTTENKATCSGSFHQKQLEEFLWLHVVETLKNPEGILLAIQEKNATAEKETYVIRQYIATFTQKIAELNQQRSKLLNLYLEDKVPQDLYTQKLKELDRHLEDNQAKKADYEARIQELDIPADQVESILAFCQSAIEGLDYFSFDDQRALVEMLDIRGIIDRDKGIITLTGYMPTTEISIMPPNGGGGETNFAALLSQ